MKSIICCSDCAVPLGHGYGSPLIWCSLCEAKRRVAEARFEELTEQYKAALADAGLSPVRIFPA